MMGKQASGKKGNGRALMAFVAMLGLSACAIAQKEYPPRPSEGDQLKETKLVVDADGNLSVVDRNGNEVGKPCSTNPKAKDVCPLFKPGHKVEIEEITNISIVRYKGSNCVTHMWTDYLGRAKAVTVCY